MKCRYLFKKREPRKYIIDEHREELVEVNGAWYWPVGTIEDHPAAWRLVEHGCAEAADDECEERVGKTKQQQQIARMRFAAMEKGILPEDYQRFYDGELAGYTIKGKDIPGPNHKHDYSSSVLELPPDL
jgi:hypothetical protein